MIGKEKVAVWFIRSVVYLLLLCSIVFVITYRGKILLTRSDNNVPKYTGGFSINCPPLYLFTKSSGPPTWEYYIWMYEGNIKVIKAGATLSIEGWGINSASVTGEALLDEFGAWRVKEVKNNSVLFEATKDATIRRSFEGFSITAPKATTQAVVNWEFTSPPPDTDILLKGLLFYTSGTTWGPAK